MSVCPDDAGWMMGRALLFVDGRRQWAIMMDFQQGRARKMWGTFGSLRLTLAVTSRVKALMLCPPPDQVAITRGVGGGEIPASDTRH